MISIDGIAGGVSPKKKLTVKAGDKTFTVIARIDTPQEVEYIVARRHPAVRAAPARCASLKLAAPDRVDERALQL